MTDYKHLRELAEAALEPMGDLGEPYSSGSARTAGKYVMAQRQFEEAVTPQTIIALLDERDALQARIDAALGALEEPLYYMDTAGKVRKARRILSTPTENGEEQ